MKLITSKVLFLFCLFFNIALNMSAQGNYILAPDAELVVSGSSTLHDWTMVSRQIEGYAEIDTEGEALKDIKELSISLQAKSLKSDKSGLNEDAHEALKADAHPEITFKLERVNSLKTNRSQYLVDAEGTVTIAGVSKMINIHAEGHVISNGVTFKGSKKLRMTDFNMEPPKAMLGILKADDEVTVSFNVTFRAK